MQKKIFGRTMIVENDNFPFVMIDQEYFKNDPKPSDEISHTMDSLSQRLTRIIWNYKQLLEPKKPTTKPPKHRPVWSFGLPDTFNLDDEIPPLPRMDISLNLTEY